MNPHKRANEEAQEQWAGLERQVSINTAQVSKLATLRETTLKHAREARAAWREDKNNLSLQERRSNANGEASKAQKALDIAVANLAKLQAMLDAAFARYKTVSDKWAAFEKQQRQGRERATPTPRPRPRQRRGRRAYSHIPDDYEEVEFDSMEDYLDFLFGRGFNRSGSARTRFQGNIRPQAAPLPASKAIPASAFAAWKAEVEKSFLDLSTMSDFPTFPSSSCAKLTCSSSAKNRKLEACGCDIEAAFRTTIGFPASLKTERIRWHPDKFARCPEDLRGDFIAMACEVFVVIERLHNELNG